MFAKKETQVEELVVRHFALVHQTLGELQKMVDDYLAQDKVFKQDSSKIGEAEHEADRVRREVVCKLYEGAFLPVYREDYIMLVEQLDQVANQAEAVSQFIVLTRPPIPDMIRENLRSIARDTLVCFEVLMDALEEIQKDRAKSFAVAEAVQDREKEIDELVWQTVKKIFKSDLPKADKIHVKMLIDRIAAISNRIEDTSDRLAVMAVKRNV